MITIKNRKMKSTRIIKLTFLLAVFSQMAFAQEPITHNLYTTNPYLINPAAAGSKESINLLLDVYYQWASFSEAPRIYTFAADAPFKENMGFGLNLYSDQRSFFNHTIAMANYAYKIKFSEKTGISLGMGLGIVNNNLNFDGVHPADPSDPLFNTEEYNSTHLGASAGFIFNHKDLHVHFAMPQMLQEGNIFQDQYNLFALYNYAVNEKITISPSVLLRSFPGNIFQEDFNLMGTWNNTYWLQGGYRSDKSFLASAGFNISSLFIAYCFQGHSGEIKNFGGSSHEILLGYSIKKKKEKPITDPNADKINVITTMKDAKTGNPVPGTIHLLKNANVVYSCNANPQGMCNMYVDQDKYLVHVNAKGYVPIKESLNLKDIPKGTSVNYDLTPIKFEEGLEFSLGNINFETASDKLLPESYPILDEAAEIFLQYPDMIIEVGGHTDSIGGYDYNMDLSERRTKSAVQYLISKGVKEEQLIPKGYGPSKPVASNATPEGRLQNRRVVFTIIQMYPKKVEAPKKETPKPDPNAGKINVLTKIQEAKTGNPVPETVSFLQNGKVIHSCKANNQGQCNIYVEPGKYDILFNASGYIPIRESLDVTTSPKGSTVNKLLRPIKLEKGLEFSLGSINFETASDKLLPESYPVLDEAAELFKLYPNMKIEVGGHTDNVGNLNYNKSLSERRAKSATEYLVSKGVKKEQLLPKGYGPTKPIASNDTPEERLQNRRVVFTILEM
jgi:type IX secretion system PorP/SprF family membrane protein